MSQVRHHAMMAQNKRILKEEVLRLQSSQDEAKKLTAAEAEEHTKGVANLKASLVAVQKELKKEKADTEVAKGSINELRQALDAAKTVEKDLGAKVDLSEARIKELEAQNKLVLYNLAKVEVETTDKINAGRDDLVDLAMYRVWEHNQNIDISFMQGENEGLLNKWKARLDEEKELRSITTSGAISEDDENDHDVISSVLKTGSSRSEEIARETREVFAADDQVVTEAEPPAPSNEPPAVGDSPTTQP